MQTKTSTLATIITFGAVALGAVVCATDSSASCPNWPGCYVGQITPAGDINPIIEFTHRVFSASTLPLLIVAGVVLRKHPSRRVRWLPWVAALGALGAAIFGMLIIKVGISAPAAMIDLWCALTALCGIVMDTAMLRPAGVEKQPPWVVYELLGGLFLMHGLGVIAAGKGSYTRCMGWPLWFMAEADKLPAVQVFRVVLAVILLAGLLWLGYRTKHLGLFGVLLGCELAIGVVIHMAGLNGVWGSLYGVTAVAIVTAVAWVAGKLSGSAAQ
ncbi:MAG: cytochrome oxidase assembly protein [Corynebacterium sp.]|nr:cytochrome oxidase assembly protein [Corynebacterium sp.]